MKLSETLCAIGAAVIYSGVTAVATGQQYPYALFELPPLDGNWPGALAQAIDDRGQVAGGTYWVDQTTRAVMWDTDGAPRNLGTLGGGEFSSAWGINDKGELAGTSSIEPGRGAPKRAFLWRDGEMFDLGTLGGTLSEAYGINNQGRIVGWAGYDLSGSAAFVWDSGQMRELPSYIVRGGVAYGINNHSQIAGRVIGKSGSRWPALWENEQLIVLPNLGRNPSVARAINDLGQIVGQSVNSSGKYHAVAWINREILDLHRQELGSASLAWGINNSGQVVGWVGQDVFNRRAFVWQQGLGMRTLDSAVPPRLRANWRIYIAQGINDAGQIAAIGVIPSDPFTQFAFLVNPVSPTLQLSAPSPGRAGTSNTITLTGATPGATVQFLYSRFGGGQRIPGCDLQQNALQLDSPTVIGTAVADSNGVASITRTVPPVAQNQTILFQAVVQGECAISQLVVHQFE